MEILATPLAKNKAKKGATEIGRLRGRISWEGSQWKLGRLSGSNKLGRVGRLVD